MHAYANANANAMQLRTKHLKCYIYYTLGAGERCRDGSLCAVSTRRQRTGRANYTWWTAAPTIDRKNKLAQVQRASSQIEYRNGGREDDAGPSTDDRVNQQFVLDLG
jgi:hypothetical protein